MELCSMLRGSLDGGRMNACICMAAFFRCSSETSTTPLIGYTTIQNKTFKKREKKTCLYYGKKQHMNMCSSHPGTWKFFPFVYDIFDFFHSVQFSHSVVSNSATPWTAACQASLSITNSWSLPKLMSIELVIPSSDPFLCHPLLLLPPIAPSIRVFSNESTLRLRWPKYWEFQLQHQSFQWTPRIDLL